MKKILLILSYFLIFFIGFGRFLPTFYAPSSVHQFFSNYGVLLHIPAILLMIILAGFILLKKINKKAIWIIVIIYMVLWLSVPLLEEMDNRIVIATNKDKKIEEFFNPILGMQMELKNKENKVLFKFKNLFEIYEALIYQPNHKIDMNIFEIKNDSHFKKVYNKDWWWYEHFN